MIAIDKLISESKCASLTEQEEIRLFNIYIDKQEGWKEARDSIIESCLLYVIKCAHSYSSDPNRLEDLVSEGLVGLLESFDRYELNKGARFLTYASFAVKGKMLKFLYKNYFGTAFSIPINISSKVTLIKIFIEKIEEETGNPPDRRAIADKFDLDEISLNVYLDLLNFNAFSLNSQTNNEIKNYGQKNQEIEDSETHNPYLDLEKKDTAQILKDIISNLPERQRIIINKRFGFTNGDVVKLCQIGEELFLTKQRVSQIEFEALEVIRKELEKIQSKSKSKFYLQAS